MLTMLTDSVNIVNMIQNFQCKDTEALFIGKRVARFVNIERIAMRKLQQINAATSLDFLRIPPGNRLEKMAGNRLGQWSVRINEQWRVCFRFRDGHALDVAIVDCH